MFHQFKVISSHRDYLRSLWGNDGDYSKDPQEYRKTVDLFGATSSQGCANFGFRRVAEDYQDESGERAADFKRLRLHKFASFLGRKVKSNDQEPIQSDPRSCPQNRKGNN